MEAWDIELEIENIFLEIASFGGPTKRLFICVILVAAQIHGPQLAFGNCLVEVLEAQILLLHYVGKVKH